MKVLYVTGACLFRNTSANMSHNAYVRGLIENGVDLDIIMASDSWGESDSKFRKQTGARYFIYNSVSIPDRIRLRSRGLINSQGSGRSNSAGTADKAGLTRKSSVKTRLRRTFKRFFYSLFRPDPIYPLNKTWLKKARSFRSDVEYDLVVSNSSPAAGHRLVADLLARKHIKASRWVQIWEDPWYYDLYGNHSDAILEEEHNLLREAREVLYVSPLTLHYQKMYFPDCADKMGVIPLPAFLIGNQDRKPLSSPVSFGYFGDYYSHTRNLSPFYEALKDTGSVGFIYGDSDLKLPSTSLVTVSPRVTLDVLEKVQDKTDVLVHLSNLGGGQIPGKIYHYSVTKKPILFILDGTEEEKSVLKDHFSQFGRYVFCDNTLDDIVKAMSLIGGSADYVCTPVSAFTPLNVVGQFLSNG